VYHHIDDNRTANTALYFDGSSYISIPHHVDVDPVSSDYTYEAWFKPDAMIGNSSIMSKGGHGNATDLSGISCYFGSSGQTFFSWYSGSSKSIDIAPGNLIKTGVWQHYAAVRMVSDLQSGTTGSVRLFLDGVCVKEVSGSTADDDHDTGTKAFNIGANHEAGGTGQYYLKLLKHILHLKII
jgi:hypothetical protein